MTAANHITIARDERLALPYKWVAQASVLSPPPAFDGLMPPAQQAYIGYGTTPATALAALLVQLSDDDALPSLYHRAYGLLLRRRRITRAVAAQAAEISQARLARALAGTDMDTTPDDIVAWGRPLGISVADLRSVARELIASGKVLDPADRRV